MSSAIAIAQMDAEKAKDGVKKVEQAVREFRQTRELEMRDGRATLMAEVTRMGGAIDGKIIEQQALMASAIDTMTTRIGSGESMHAQQMEGLKADLNNRDASLKTQVYDLLRGFFTAGADGTQTAAHAMVQTAMAQYANDLNRRLKTEVGQIINDLDIGGQVDIRIDSRLTGLEGAIQAQADAILGNAGLDDRIGVIVAGYFVLKYFRVI